MTPEEAQNMRDQALFALVQRAGGHVTVTAEELPAVPFSFARRWTPEGGIEIMIRLDGRPT